MQLVFFLSASETLQRHQRALTPRHTAEGPRTAVGDAARRRAASHQSVEA